MMRSTLLAVLLIPTIAGAGSYVTGNTTPFADKNNAKPCTNPDPTKCLIAADMNTLKDAAGDLRTHARHEQVKKILRVRDTAIQAAVNAAETGPSVVYFPEGTGTLNCIAMTEAAMLYPMKCEEKIVITGIQADSDSKRLVLQTSSTGVTVDGIVWSGGTGTINFFAPMEAAEKFHIGQTMVFHLAIEF